MLTKSQIDQFYEDGYLLIPNFFDSEQIAGMRSGLNEIFRSSSHYPSDTNGNGVDQSIRVDICARGHLTWLLRHKALIDVLTALLGARPIVLPEVVAHESGYGPWHKDTTSQERNGHKFHWDEDYAMLEVGIYLQDNHPEFGGGLDVIPKSHKMPDRYASPLGRLVNKGRSLGLLPDIQGRYTIPHRAGDLVLFHFRTDHRATPTQKRDLGPDRRKLAIFIACSRNNSHAGSYLKYLRTRSSYAYLDEHTYPKDFVDEVSRAGLELW